MGATVITNIAFRAVEGNDGQKAILYYANGYDKNTYPRSYKWQRIAAETPGDILQVIGRECRGIEDGILQYNPNIPVTEEPRAMAFAKRCLAALREGVTGIKVPEKVVIADPSFTFWREEGYASKEDMRQRFLAFLASRGIDPEGPREVVVKDAIGLLVELETLWRGCHDAFPSKPSALMDRVIPVLPAPRPGRNPAPGMSVQAIEGCDLLWVRHNDTEHLFSSIMAAEHYWLHQFPIDAAYEDWESPCREVYQAKRNAPSMSPDDIILMCPPASGPESSRGWLGDDLWRERYKIKEDRLTLAESIERFGVDQAQFLALSCHAQLRRAPTAEAAIEAESFVPSEERFGGPSP